MLREICSVSDREDDDFVGLRFTDGTPSVVFPRGFAIPDDDKQLRRDTLRLLSTIGKFGGRREGDRIRDAQEEVLLSFPILSYQYIIYDFLSRGYYSENEVRYVESTKGKINWKRTMQKEQAQLDAGNVVYLNFVVKTNHIQNDNLISKIHEYCVYDSFKKLGWLYVGTDLLPRKPSVRFNKRLFLSVLQHEMGNTFIEQKRRLFQSMINVLSWTPESGDDQSDASYGVNRFEHIWEGMIDYVFGDENRELYYPRARWKIIRGRGYEAESSELRPDTVVKLGDKVFILDAKYYKYGITFNPFHLPQTDSIQKQITYGEYVARKGFAERNNIYNAFIMPFNCGGDEPFRFVSVGTADWKEYSEGSPNYEFVLGILLDTTYLLRSYAKHNMAEIEKVTTLIEQSLAEYRATAD